MSTGDIIVLVIIGFFVLVGFLSGLILSVYRIISFFLATYLSVKFSPVVSEYLRNTGIYGLLKSKTTEYILGQIQGKLSSLANSAPGGGIKLDAAQGLIQSLQLPEPVKKILTTNLPDPSKLINSQDLLSNISGNMTILVTNAFGTVITFLAVSIVLFLIGIILKFIVKLPVIKQADRLGGAIFGIFQGTAIVYAIFAALVLFGYLPVLSPYDELAKQSVAGKFLYYNNILANWVLGLK